MGWIECAKSFRIGRGWDRTTKLPDGDYNCSGGPTTISDNWGEMMWLVTSPGDRLMDYLATTEGGQFVEISNSPHIGSIIGVLLIVAIFFLGLMAVAVVGGIVAAAGIGLWLLVTKPFR